ncbi:hypothetical protein FB45DRAFT_1027351 [Roridomyces roridus]|uniref:Uncharacterized protein n=1 Tax=Roridomyces roridus TaxID=1738132 RepID=A0AAD7BXQ1_9AGAR|nr:hypothetical protein FB45DRAFT_1027351 [Roridomyces roridus]
MHALRRCARPNPNHVKHPATPTRFIRPRPLATHENEDDPSASAFDYDPPTGVESTAKLCFCWNPDEAGVLDPSTSIEMAQRQSRKASLLMMVRDSRASIVLQVFILSLVSLDSTKHVPEPEIPSSILYLYVHGLRDPHSLAPQLLTSSSPHSTARCTYALSLVCFLGVLFARYINRRFTDNSWNLLLVLLGICEPSPSEGARSREYRVRDNSQSGNNACALSDYHSAPS